MSQSGATFPIEPDRPLSGRRRETDAAESLRRAGRTGWYLIGWPTFGMRHYQHPTGAQVIIVDNGVVVHRSETPEGRRVAETVETRLVGAGYVLLAGGTGLHTVLYAWREVGPEPLIDWWD